MPEAELHIGKVSKPQISPETIYDVEYTQTLPTNPIKIYAPRIVGYRGIPELPQSIINQTYLVPVNGGQLSDNKMAIYRTDVDLLNGDLWEDSRKVGANREIRWQDPFSPAFITIINLNGIFPSNYANWDFVQGPNLGMRCSWHSYLVYDYINIERIPDENTRLSLTVDDIYWTDYEGYSSIAWIYVAETNTLWRAISDALSQPTDPPGWDKHTEGVIIEFPTGVNHKLQYIARYQAIVGTNNSGNKAPIEYDGIIKNPDDPNDTRTISGESISYSVLNSAFGANAVFVDKPDAFSMLDVNGDMHGTVIMTETPEN